MQQQNVPQKTELSIGEDDRSIELSESAFVLHWLSRQFHLPVELVEEQLNFSWTDKIIEIHGAQYSVKTRYDGPHLEIEPRTLECNGNAAYSYVLHTNGTLVVRMGPAVVDGVRQKYGFSPHGVPLGRFEDEVEASLLNELGLRLKLRGRMFQLDLAVDDYDVTTCLGRSNIPVKVHGKTIMLANEYLVKRGDDYPLEREFPDRPMRRQEIRILNEKGMENLYAAFDMMRVKASAIELSAMTEEIFGRVDQSAAALERIEGRLVGGLSNAFKQLQYVQVQTDRKLDTLIYGQDTLYEQGETQLLQTLLVREDLESGFARSSNLIGQTELTQQAGFSQLAGLLGLANQQREVAISQRDESIQLQTSTVQKLDRLSNQVSNLTTEIQAQRSEILSLLNEQRLANNRWRDLSEEIKLQSIVTLYSIHDNMRDVVADINREFRVTRQALEKFIKLRGAGETTRERIKNIGVEPVTVSESHQHQDKIRAILEYVENNPGCTRRRVANSLRGNTQVKYRLIKGLVASEHLILDDGQLLWRGQS